ncbi:uncharacterized protein [Procambarus clarkii]|uniref:uncharacterized protein n=1 Tax=Procambarus clarkii TaxID=6728 RepID=UPI0037426072
MEAADKMKRTLIGLKGHLTRQITKCQNLSQQSPVDYIELEDLLQVVEGKIKHIKQHMNLYLTELYQTSIGETELEDIVSDLAQYEDDVQLVDQLKLKPIARVNLNISGFLTNSGPRDYQVVKVLARLGGCTSPIQAIVVDKIPSDLHVTGLAQTVKRSGTTNDENKLVEIYHEANRELLGANMPLQSWTSNNKQLNQIIEEEFPDYKVPRKLKVLGKAYGSVAYLVNTQQSFLLTSKARVAPFKRRSLPQMEFTALLVGVRLAHCLIKTLSNVHLSEIVVWSENKAVLQWVKNDNNKTPYVSNQVGEIRELSAGYKLRHVPTKDNPADYLSRGLTLKQLVKTEMWFNVPQWLVSGQWPQQKPQVIVTNITTPVVDPEPPRTLAINPHRYSNLSKFLRVTELVFDFINKVGIKYRFPSSIKYWVKQAQQETYGKEYEHLPERLSKSLGIWLDSDSYNILRCGGRLLHAEINLDTKNPILLPRHHIITKLIALHYHEHNTLHGGVLDTLTEIRQCFWLPQGRQTVKSLIKSCVICKKYDARVCPYPGPPPLPKERVVHLRPFETTGVDYTGALILTGTPDKIPVKAYIYHFTCATTRGVHLEVTSDMSAKAFLQAFHRFAARRSCPKLMISDNGSNLVAGEACLQEIWNHPKLHSVLKQRQCYWKFIPLRAPWHGGFYERVVGTVKKCLRKTLHWQKNNLTELQTLVVEIEARVNNRPLTYLTEDFSQREPLSPSHLIHGGLLSPLISLVDKDPADPSCVKASDLVESYRHLSRVIEKWNEVWTREYLTALREYHYGAASPYNKVQLKPGDLVLVE